MNRLLIIIILLGFFQQRDARAQQEQYSMSLQEAIDYALVNSQNILNAQLDMISAEALTKENIAFGLPQVSGNIDIADNFELPTSFMPAEFFGGQPEDPSVPVQFGTKYSGSATISGSQMVFDGVFFVGLQAAKTFQELSSKRHISTKIDVVEAVTKAYYNVLVNKLTIELVDKNFGRLDTLLSDTKKMYESGFAERIDVSRVQLQYNNIKVTRDNSTKMLAFAESLLKFQMGMPIENEVILTDKLSLEMFDDTEESTFNYENRIEYSILGTQEELALLAIKRTKVAYIPTMDIYATIGAVAGTGLAANIFNVGNDWYGFGIVGLRMNIPIFDGMMKHNQLQQQKADLSKIHNSYDQLKNSINLELQQTQLLYTNSIDYMNMQLENMDISEYVYNVTKTKYQQGVGSNIEVMNADADYKKAQTDFFEALYQALLAKVNYDKALGKLN